MEAVALAGAQSEVAEAREALIGPLGWRLQKFFTRRPNAFGARVTWHGARHMLREMVGGGVKMRICRIPAEYVAEAMIQRPHGKRHETAEHRRERAAVRTALANDDETPDPRAFGSPWKSQKDGKHWFGDRHPRLLRK